MKKNSIKTKATKEEIHPARKKEIKHKMKILKNNKNNGEKKKKLAQLRNEERIWFE